MMRKSCYTYWWVRYLKHNVWHAEELTGREYDNLKHDKNVVIISADRIV